MFDNDSLDFSIFENDEIEDFSKLRRDYKKINKDPVKKELIERIFKKDNLLNMDDDDLVEEIKKKFTDKETVKVLYTWLSYRLKYITEKAQTFRRNILSTYSYLPPNKIMKKAIKYAKHLHFTPSEFDVFRKMFMIEYQTPLSSVYNIEDKEFQNSGAMATLLNYKPKEEERGKLNYENSESGIVDNIIKSAIATEDLFYYCVSSSVSYHFEENLYNEIKIKKDYKTTDCVPPVIAAMFIQKIPYFDLHMIVSNIGKLIQHSYEHKKLTSYENNLRLTLASDTSQYSDQTGKLISPLKDLQIRASIQQSLWKLVLFLRNKQALNCDCTKFYNLISMYAPDLFVSQRYKNQTHQDSINIITRLFHVFSLYPLRYNQTLDYNDKYGKEKKIIYRSPNDSNVFMIKKFKGIDSDAFKNIQIEFNKERNASFIFIRPQKIINQEYNNGENITKENSDETNTRNNFALEETTKKNNYYSLTLSKGIIGIHRNLFSPTGYNENNLDSFTNNGHKITYSKAEGVVVVLVLRNVNASNFNVKKNGDLESIYKYSSFKNLIIEYDTTKVLFSDVVTYNKTDFVLTSVVLNSIYEDKNRTDEQGNSNNTLKTKGSPFCIVRTNTDNKSLIYHPYNFDLIKTDNGGYINGPFNFIEEGFGNSTMGGKNDLTEIIENYGEIFIYSQENFKI